MKNFLYITIVLGMAEFAPAAIVSLSNNADCYAQQIDGTGGGVVYAGVAPSGPSLNYHDPYTATAIGSRNWTTEALFVSWVSTNTPTFAQVDGYFVGTSAIGGTSPPGISDGSQVFASDTLIFTLDTAGTVSLINYNVGISTSGSSPPMVYETKLSLDGVDYQVSAANATFTLPVGVGTHTASYSMLADAFKAGWSNADYSSGGTLQSQHQIRVSSVPEPSSAMVWVLGAGLLLGTRRSRA
ncbi:MAG: hypothetical protein WCJ66_10930 [Verrucomicrobiota bacterium]